MMTSISLAESLKSNAEKLQFDIVFFMARNSQNKE